MRQVLLIPWHRLDPSPHIAGRRVIAPNPRAAAALGVPAESLESLAHRRLAGGPLGVAPRLVAHRLMRDLIGEDGLARAYAPVISSFLRAGADLDAVEAQGPVRARRLAGLAREYQARLRAAGMLDAAEVMRAAQQGPPEPLLVTGYPRLGDDERHFLDAAAADGSVLLLPYLDHPNFTENDESAAFFASRGWEVVREVGGPAETAACYRHRAEQIAALVYPDQDAELRGALAGIKALLADAVPPEEIALVARHDAAYGPLALAIAWEYGVPLRALYAVALTETRLGAALAAWVDAAAEGEAWPEEATVADWLTRVEATIEEAPSSRSRPQEALAARALTEGLPVLLGRGDEVLTREAFGRTLREALSLLTVPAHPGRGGVELHTPLSLFGAHYRHVFVVGMAENVLPAPVVNSPVLDFHDRRLLGACGCRLEDAAAAARRELLSFLSLLQVAGESLTLSYPRLLAGKPALPSAYFEALGLRPLPPGERSVCSPEEARHVWMTRVVPAADEDPETAAAREGLAVEQRREAPEAPDAHDGVIGVRFDADARVFSPSQLTMFGQCGFRWFVQHALGIRALEEPDLELQPSTRGSLYHKTLELAVEASRGAPDLRAAVTAELDAAIRAAEVAIELPALPAWEVRREEHLQLLRQAVAGPDFLVAGAEVVALEAPFEATWRGLKLRGVVDRIDRAPDGLVLIDYKTSSSPPKGAQDADGKAKLDLQLPIYMEAAAPRLFPGEAIADATYYSLTKARVLARAKPDDAALGAFVTRLRQQLAEGSFPVRPDLAEEACTYCDAALACRKGARLARKRSSSDGREE